MDIFYKKKILWFYLILTKIQLLGDFNKYMESRPSSGFALLHKKNLNILQTIDCSDDKSKENVLSNLINLNLTFSCWKEFFDQKHLIRPAWEPITV